MSAKQRKRPSPDELLAEVEGIEAVRTYAFDEYLPVIHALQTKDFSYAKIAEFLKERLGYVVSRGQVYRAYQMWLEEQRQAAEEVAGLRPKIAGPSFNDEIEEKVYVSARELIEQFEKEAELSGEPNAPWNDAEIVLNQAASILKSDREAREAAEREAAAADIALESRKTASNGSSKR